ncbi:MAG: tRNA dihydrouridine(20/20a) synthase DusA [Chromatiales bacterium]|nr:MAG: tRNA dihydrouridine(20/20a) synthase DusA [Chromatiales bacterium]
MQRRVCVAPMMDCTDRHCRYFHRLLAPKVGLYTEMITARAIVHGDPERLLAFAPVEHPVALQLGGSEPEFLRRAAAIVRAGFPYDELNLNVGCPSDRVQSGRFGACLMADPELVADCLRALAAEWDGPVTVKCRIGIDAQDDYGFLAAFVGTMAAAGCRVVIVHARKAILQGLSPKENRSIPPLRYDRVHRLKRDFPDLEIILNGGVDSIDKAEHELNRVDGVMIGRKAYADPCFLAGLQARCLDGATPPVPDRAGVVRKMAAYAATHVAGGGRLQQVTRHMHGLYAGQPGAARWRRYLAEAAACRDADADTLLRSLELFEAAA